MPGGRCDVSRWSAPLAVAVWMGSTLVLADVPWFARGSLVERLRPYAPGGMGRPARRGLLSVDSFRDVVGPTARVVGERIARLMGVSDDLELRLRRSHSEVDVTAFRLRQAGVSGATFAVAALVATGLALPGAVTLGFVVGASALAFLLHEQQATQASARWQQQLVMELPTVAEQLALLLTAGWSLTAALQRLARRAEGASARDLRRVCARVEQGVDEAHALTEWARVARVPAVDRLVAVLALNRETTHLGRLITEEARSIRRDLHRELIELTERRAQQVWIPVTVATLVPGVLFMAIPFVDALRMFGA